MESSPVTKAKIDAARNSVWTQFTNQLPNMVKDQFMVQIFDDDNISAEIFFKEGPGSLQSVFGSDRKYWSQRMKTVLGLTGVDGFPYQLLPLKTKRPLPIPAVNFTESPGSILGKLYSGQMKIYAMPEEFFTARFREIFKETILTHMGSAESKNWLGGLKMKYWPQQLNFGVLRDAGLRYFSRNLQQRPLTGATDKGFLPVPCLFHSQMGGVQSMSALPGDPTLNQFDNHYDVAAHKRICAEFGVDPSSHFHFTTGKNHGLGRVNGEMQLAFKYPGWMKFSDEGGKPIDGNRISYIRPDPVANTQYDWSAPKTASGLTQAGLSRINQTIEAFVYCILGVQVNIRSSILGEGGRAKEAQTEFLKLMEDAIKQPDLGQSVQRYQLAVDQAKVRN